MGPLPFEEVDDVEDVVDDSAVAPALFVAPVRRPPVRFAPPEAVFSDVAVIADVFPLRRSMLDTPIGPIGPTSLEGPLGEPPVC